ncbi:MAG: hypothetical protein KGJ57_13020 [Sphingomonadales bacterium]|nr:hypothetical protein [Sphingomonadales bacterium]MDE2170334.1 hypothetical protein [Sphingomonadales bacterium]
MSRKLALALALAATPLLAGCGLHPLYAGGGHAAIAQGLEDVDVPAIPGQQGWLMRNALMDRMHPDGRKASTGRYRLDVRLDDKLEGLGVLANDTVGRERRTLRARYQLVDTATGDILLDATAGSDAGIDVVSSEYATVAAEQTALENLTRVVADRIVTSLAVRLRQEAAKGESVR